MSAHDVEVMDVAIRERSSVLLTPVMDVNTAMKRLEEFQTFCANYLQESKDGGQDGGDYGVIPGTKKKTLLKSGADKLCEVYGLYDEYIFETKVEDWDRGLFDYGLKCVLKSRRDDSMVGSGLGSCSSFESKYRWRDEQKKCPHCNAAAIIKGKDFKNDGLPTGWLCFGKKGGCGAKFKDGDKTIEGQVTGRVQNEDIADIKNSILKMAKKRAKIDAVIGVTRSSGLFAQDLEDFPMPPPKAEPARTTEDIEIKPKSAVAHGAPGGEETVKRVSTPPPAAETVSTAASVGSGNVPAEARAVTSAVEYISIGQQKNFHKECRAAVPPARSFDADDLTYKWLGDNDYRDKIGLPTAAMIPAAGWLKVREAAIAWLKQQ